MLNDHQNNIIASVKCSYSKKRSNGSLIEANLRNSKVSSLSTQIFHFVFQSKNGHFSGVVKIEIEQNRPGVFMMS